MSDEDYKIVDTMEAYGGSFVKSLATCFRQADHVNFKKLKEAFPKYWEEYKKMSKE